MRQSEVRVRNHAQGRSVAVCWMGGRGNIEINARMVTEGWAMADPETGRTYARLEQVSKRARRGLWAGALSVLPFRKGTPTVHESA